MVFLEKIINTSKGNNTVGSFDMGCAISGLTIHESDSIGYMILQKSTTPSDPRIDMSLGTSWFTYSTDMYKPFLPAVYGTYGDYGMIVDIEKSKTGEVIEQLFDMPVEDLIECISCTRGLYERDGKIAKKLFKGSRRFQNFDATPEDGLTRLGFTKEKSEKDVEVYSFEGFEILVGFKEPFHLWTIREAESKKILFPEFPCQFVSTIINEFCKLTGKFPGYTKEDQEKVQLLQSLSGMFFLKDVFAEMNAHMQQDYFADMYEKQWNETWGTFMAAYNACKKLGQEDKMHLLPLRLAQSIERSTSFPVEKMSLLAGYDGTSEFSEMFDMFSVMTSVNRMFMPSFCGEQEGNDDASRKLNAISGRILAERKARWDEEDEED